MDVEFTVVEGDIGRDVSGGPGDIYDPAGRNGNGAGMTRGLWDAAESERPADGPPLRLGAGAGKGAGKPEWGRWPTAPEAMLAVLRTGRILAGAATEDDVLRLASEAARRILGFTSCAVAMRTSDGSFAYRHLSGSGPEGEAALRGRVLSSEGLGALLEAATVIGGVYWIPPGHPVRDRADVEAGTLSTGVSVEEGSWRRGSLLLAPMVDGAGRTVGFFSPDDPVSGDLPTVAEALLLESLVELTEIGLETVRSRNEAQRALAVAEAQRGQLEALLVASVQVRGRGALGEVLGEIARSMTEAAGFRRAAIYTLEPETQMLVVRASVGLSEEDDARLRGTPIPLVEFAQMMRPEMRVSRSYLLDHRVHEVPAELDDKLSIPDEDPDWTDGAWHALDSLTVPLEDADGSLIGVISVDEPVSRRLPAVADIRALELFADQCSIAVVQANRYEQALADAGTDPLTGLPNRRALDARAGQLASGAHRSGLPCCLALIDIDHFKSVNDRFGHLTGDLVIRAVGTAMTDRLRAADLVARYGGEEFVAVFPGTGLTEAVAVVDDLRQRIAELDLEPIAGSRVRISGGVTRMRADEPLTAAFARADRALYRAKQAGRDRVAVELPEGELPEGDGGG